MLKNKGKLFTRIARIYTNLKLRPIRIYQSYYTTDGTDALTGANGGNRKQQWDGIKLEKCATKTAQNDFSYHGGTDARGNASLP